MFLKKLIEQKRKLEKKEGKKYYTKKLKKINKKRQNKKLPSDPPSMLFIMYIIKSLVKPYHSLHPHPLSGGCLERGG